MTLIIRPSSIQMEPITAFLILLAFITLLEDFHSQFLPTLVVQLMALLTLESHQPYLLE